MKKEVIEADCYERHDSRETQEDERRTERWKCLWCFHGGRRVAADNPLCQKKWKWNWFKAFILLSAAPQRPRDAHTPVRPEDISGGFTTWALFLFLCPINVWTADIWHHTIIIWNYVKVWSSGFHSLVTELSFGGKLWVLWSTMWPSQVLFSVWPPDCDSFVWILAWLIN